MELGPPPLSVCGVGCGEGMRRRLSPVEEELEKAHHLPEGDRASEDG